MRSLIAAFLLAALAAGPALAQTTPLSVEKIMQDPKTWVGAWPSQPFWSEDGQTLFFYWNPRGEFPSDSLFMVPRTGGTPVQVPPAQRRQVRPTFDGWHHGEHVYDAAFARKVFAEQGDLFVHDRRAGTTTRLTQTREREADPRFTPDGRGVVYAAGNNLYRLDLATGATVQLTDLRSGKEPAEAKEDAQQRYLREENLRLLGILRQRKEEREARQAARDRDEAARNLPPTYYYGSRSVQQLQIDPSERYVSFVLYEAPTDGRPSRIFDYLDASGFAREVNARPKVGSPQGTGTLYVQDLQRDTTYQVDLHQLPGAYDVPAYRSAQGVAADSSKTKRGLYAFGPFWSGDGRYAVVEVRAQDNKDRWIARLDPATGALTVIDRQHDEAWIAGPGISWFGGRSTLGWMPDNRHIYFQSERTGYSHLYTADVERGTVRALTSGAFEVSSPLLSRDGQTWFFTATEVSPFEPHFYRMPAAGGRLTRLTTLEGDNQAVLNPDETLLAVHHSFVNRPPEVYLQRPQAAPQRLTHSPTAAWLAYDWRNPEIRMIPASDGAQVPAQVFVPAQPNGAAVLFVHGAGYLQNVHKGWSNYFREYMFHNLLTDLGYTVLNVDYRASAGYGRDWRTAVYRHMGGRDLQDYVDASRYVGTAFGIDPERVFIYGGSYGGFITLMALFTEPEHFGGGAALRSVTDWAHYNHGYTANILNTPALDSLAYRRSSPIYFAEGLDDPLLIAHGVLDDNVQVQDVLRLTQRLIELGKDDWELALYPIEPHGFTEPESWADEYKRILKLIHQSVGPDRLARQTVPALNEPDTGGR